MFLRSTQFSKMNSGGLNYQHRRNRLGPGGVFLLFAWCLPLVQSQGVPLQHVGKVSMFRVIPAGSSVELSCELNDPTVAVSLWQMLPSGTMFTPRQNVARYGQVFVLHLSSKTTEGFYFCRARQHNGRHFNKMIGRITIDASPKDSPTPVVDKKYRSVFVGRDSNLTCRATGDKISSVYWYKHARKLNTQHQDVRQEQTSKGETWINTLMLKEVGINAAGLYECRVSETGQTMAFWSAHVMLNVLEKTECPELDGIFADPHSKTGYLMCADGVSTKKNCSKALEWDDNKKSCDIPVKPIRWESESRLRRITNTVGDSVLLDCSLTDPEMKVNLKQRNSNGGIKHRVVDGCKVTLVGQTFLLHAVNFNDIGIYSCYATNTNVSPSPVKEVVFLNVNPGLFSAFPQGTRNLMVPIGSSVDLNCEAYSVPQPLLSLEILSVDGTTKVTPDGYNVTLTGRVFTVHRLDYNMKGKVVCRVMSACSDRQADVELGFLLPVPQRGDPPVPKIIPPHSNSDEHTDVLIRCMVSRENIQSIEWYKDKRKLPKERFSATKAGSELRLNSISQSDAGVYECRVTNFGVGYWPGFAVVNVTDKSVRLSPTNQTPPGVATSTAEISAFESTDIVCGSLEEYSDVTLLQAPFRGRGLVRRVPDGVNLILQGGVFTITQAQSTDKGKYYCQFAELTKVPVLILQVIDHSPAYEEVFIPTKPKTIDYMGGVDLICVTGTSQSLNWIIWMKSDHSGTTLNVTNKATTTIHQSSSEIQLVLHVRNASKTDAGNYICRARFGDRVKETSTQLMVQDLAKAQILDHSGSPVVNKSQAVELWCIFVGSPQAQIIWQRNGDILGGCRLKWGAVNCWAESARYYVSFRDDTSYLRFPSAVYPQDDDVYTCSVDNMAGGQNVSIKVTVQVKPYIVKNTTEEVLLIGANDNTRLDCSILHSNPSPSVSWWFLPCPTSVTTSKNLTEGWKRLLLTNTSSTASLAIPPSPQHALYRCVAENCQGSDYLLFTILRLDVQPPNILNFTSRVLAKASQEVRLFCTARGNPLPDIHWTKDGSTVGSCQGEILQRTKTCSVQPRFGKYKLLWTGSGSELVIQSAFHPFDAGDFKCFARNVAGTENRTISLVIHEKPVLNKLNKTELHVLSYEAATTIESHALRGHPVPHFKWFHQPIRICISGCKPDSKKWRRVPRSAAVSPPNKIPSRISSLFLPPSRFGFFYRCVAENSLGKDDVLFSVHRIDTQAFLPQIIPPPSGLRVEEGSSLTLQCRASEWDFLYLTWQRRSGRSMSSNLKLSEHNLTAILTMDNLRPSDAGDYICVGWTNNDTKSSMVTVSVTAFVPPVVSLGLNQEIHEAQTNKTILRCDVISGYPRPNITWYRNGTEISLQAIGPEDKCRINGFHYIENYRPPHAEYLVICRPNHVDNTGIYRCSAVNSKGANSSEVFLNVLANPRILEITDRTLPKELGEKLNLSCKATGNPAPSVRWVRKTAYGEHNSVPLRDGKNDTLFIESLEEEHFGDYACVAENMFGNDTVVLAIVKPSTVQAREKQPSSGTESVIAVIVVSGAMFLLLIVIAAILYHRRKLYGGFYLCSSPPLPDLISRLDEGISLLDQVNKLPYEKRWEFPREHLHLDKIIGSGAFGEVYLAEADGALITDTSSAVSARHRLSIAKRDSRRGSAASLKGPIRVAVKTLKEGADESEHKDLLSELKILIHIGSHKNIVNLLGACTKGRLCDLCVIIEYCPYGSMLHFLRARRDLYKPAWLPPTENSDEQYTMTDLVSSAFQVARAMEFLVSRKCIHRDLAARNVLVGANYVVKVADFGLARDVYKDDKYIKVSSGLVPVKWMAIESLTDRVYSEQSDVWSFGVFLWELFTLGGNPYPTLRPTEVYQFLKEGNRMEPPLDCPEEMYRMMTDCWMEKPEDRPNFAALVQRLDHVIESNMAAMGREAYLDLGTGCPEETDANNYLRPVDSVSSINQSAMLNGKVSSERDLHVRSQSPPATEASSPHERYTELGFKPLKASDVAENSRL